MRNNSQTVSELRDGAHDYILSQKNSKKWRKNKNNSEYRVFWINKNYKIDEIVIVKTGGFRYF
jgi:hypothetical protein